MGHRLVVYYRYNSTLFIIDITYIRWARKPVNHTNRMDVVCCHLMDRPQSVSQLSYNRTFQFSKTFRLKRNAIFSRSSNVILPLENPLNVICKQFKLKFWLKLYFYFVYYTIPFGFSLFWHFRVNIFYFWNHFIWRRITDGVPVNWET